MLRAGTSRVVTAGTIAGPSKSAVATSLAQFFVRDFHASLVARKGGPRPKKHLRGRTNGSSRTKLVKSVTKSKSTKGAYFHDIPGGSAKPFTGKRAFGSPYGREPSMDPASNTLSQKEIWMRARTKVAKADPENINGTSVYRDAEWNAEAKRANSRYGLKGDIRESRQPTRKRLLDLRGSEAVSQRERFEASEKQRRQQPPRGSFGLRSTGSSDFGAPSTSRGSSQQDPWDNDDTSYSPDQDRFDPFRTERYPSKPEQAPRGTDVLGSRPSHPGARVTFGLRASASPEAEDFSREARLQRVRDIRAGRQPEQRTYSDRPVMGAREALSQNSNRDADEYSHRRYVDRDALRSDARRSADQDVPRADIRSARLRRYEEDEDEASDSEPERPMRWGDALRETSAYVHNRRATYVPSATATETATATLTEEEAPETTSSKPRNKDERLPRVADPARTGAVPAPGAKRRGIPRAFTHTPLTQPPVHEELAADAPSLAHEAWDPDSDDLPASFSAPPLMPGLVKSVHEILGVNAAPSAIQRLALGRLVRPLYTSDGERLEEAIDGELDAGPVRAPEYTKTLLASETGSGKTLAYLLPVLHALKHSELVSKQRLEKGLSAAPALEHLVGAVVPSPPYRALVPRALVLAPTHELARQLSASAKSLCHVIKLRVSCGSQANLPNTGGPRLRDQQRLGWQSIQGSSLDGYDPAVASEFTITRESATSLGLGTAPRARAADVFTATPARILELVRGNGWEKSGQMVDQDQYGRGGRRWEVGPPEMGLENVEWVVVDEADVLLDPDFRDHTLGILDEIARARAHLLPPDVRHRNDRLLTKAAISGPETDKLKATGPASHAMPFHLILNSATIPGLLSSTIDARWPEMARLASPGVHKLPETMRTEHVAATGNRLADVAKRIESIWAEDGRKGTTVSRTPEGRRLGGADRSKVLVFVNRGSKAAELSDFLSQRGIANIALTGTHGRQKGSNAPLLNAGFLNPSPRLSPRAGSSGRAWDHDEAEPRLSKPKPARPMDDANAPDVLITTSILSRGLDFNPKVRHVLIVDEPRNVVDLLHRAGRSARAGRVGTVTVFGKGEKGAKEVGSAVRSLAL